MNESVEWQDETYNHVFEEEITGLKRRITHDNTTTVADLEGTLKNLYISEGNNWEGRGPLGDTVISAQIAAYEHFIAEWKKELASSK
jgi:hypothetical protein